MYISYFITLFPLAIFSVFPLVAPKFGLTAIIDLINYVPTSISMVFCVISIIVGLILWRYLANRLSLMSHLARKIALEYHRYDLARTLSEHPNIFNGYNDKKTYTGFNELIQVYNNEPEYGYVPVF